MKIQLFSLALLIITCVFPKTAFCADPVTDTSKLFFYCSFDKGLEPEIGKQKATAAVGDVSLLAISENNQAVLCGEKKGQVHFYADSDIPDTGTASIWIKPEWKVKNQEKMICLLQLPFMEIFRNSKETWEAMTVLARINEKYNSVPLTIKYWDAARWYNLVVTWDKTSYQLYINNELVNSTENITWNFTPTGLIKIGATRDFIVPGIFDELKIYNKKLSIQEIKHEYEIGLNKIIGNKTAGDKNNIKKLPGVIVPKCRTNPLINGKIETGEWENAAKLDNFLIDKKNSASSRDDFMNTEIYLMHDTLNLYMCAKCNSRDIAKLKAIMKNKDDEIWKDDSIEIFFDPKYSFKKWVKIGVNSLPVISDDSGYLNNKLWDSSAETATEKIKDAWILEIKIPFSNLNFEYSPLAHMGFNIKRCMYENSEDKIQEHTYWSTPVFNDVINYGTLLFGGQSANSIEITDADILKKDNSELCLSFNGTAKKSEILTVAAELNDVFGKKYSCSQQVKFSAGKTQKVEMASKINITCDNEFKLVLFITGGDMINNVYSGVFKISAGGKEILHDIVLNPLPKKIDFSKGFFLFEDNLKIYIGKAWNEQEKFIAEHLQEVFKKNYGIKLLVEVLPEALPARAIIFGLQGKDSIAKNFPGIETIKNKKEACIISVHADNIKIGASDARGLYYGMRTLLDIITQDTWHSRPVKARCLEITDWPDIAFRGALKENLGFFKPNLHNNFIH